MLINYYYFYYYYYNFLLFFKTFLLLYVALFGQWTNIMVRYQLICVDCIKYTVLIS